MLSIQETVQKGQVKEQLAIIEKTMDAFGKFHPNLKSLDHEPIGLFNIKDEALCMQLRETLHTIPLREFLAKSGTTGIAGAIYMVPDKVHDELIYMSKNTDICPLIGRVVTGWKGGDLKVDIVDDYTYAAKEFSSGGQLRSQTVETVQATITPKSFGVNARITSDMIEDANFDIVEFHLQKAASAMGVKATSLALTVLLTGTDGVGTLNSAASGDADETKFTDGTNTDLITAFRKLGDDRWVPNTVVCTSEAWGHSLGVQALPTGWSNMPPSEGYNFKINTLDFILNNSPELHASTDVEGAAFTDCITLVFDRNNALLTGRKRWLQINNYAEPVRDLAGATITARQDSVSLYDDSIYKITED